MATLEIVAKELADLNYNSEVELESSFERNEAISLLLEKNEELMLGIDDIKDILFAINETIKETSEKIIQQGTENFVEFFSNNILPDEENEDNITQQEEVNEDLLSGIDDIKDILFTINESIKSDSEKVIENDTQNNEDLIKSQEELAEDAEREKKRDETSPTSMPSESKNTSTFGKAFDEGKKEDLGDMFGLKNLQKTIGGRIGNVVQILSMIGKNFLRFSGIGTLVIGAFNGVFKAFEWFENQEGTLGQKILAGLEGFVQGIVEIVAFPLDWIKETIATGIEGIFGENSFSDFLRSFSYLEMFSDYVDFVFNIFEDLGEWITGIAAEIGDSEWFESLKGGFDSFLNAMRSFFGWLGDKASAVAEFFGIDTVGSESKQLVELTEDQQGDQIKSSRQSGLYNKNIIGESVVDETKLDSATPAQLQAILNDEDLSPEQTAIVQEKLMEKLSSGESSGVGENQVFSYVKGSTASERLASSSMGEAVSSKVGKGTLQTSISAPTVPTVLLDAPKYQSTPATPVNSFEQYTNNMMMQQKSLERIKSEESNASLGIVNAPTSNTNVVNNTNVQGGNVNSSDPTDRNRRRVSKYR